MGEIGIKRIYENPVSSDGRRVLIDRVWPRGISKEKAALTVWMKELAPSAELRTWFGHRPERFAEFKRRYEAELNSENAKPHLELLRQWLSEGAVTLVYAAKDEEHNQAVVLQQFLEQGDGHVGEKDIT